jgi:hypothetical protein
MKYTSKRLQVLSEELEKSPTDETYRNAIEGAAGYMVSYNFR